MHKRALTALVVAAVMGPVGVASAATSYDFVLFRNTTPSAWTRVRESIIAFSYSVSTSGPRASTVICTGNVPTTLNLDGSYDFNYYASY